MFDSFCIFILYMLQKLGEIPASFFFFLNYEKTPVIFYWFYCSIPPGVGYSKPVSGPNITQSLTGFGLCAKSTPLVLRLCWVLSRMWNGLGHPGLGLWREWPEQVVRLKLRVQVFLNSNFKLEILNFSQTSNFKQYTNGTS